MKYSSWLLMVVTCFVLTAMLTSCIHGPVNPPAQSIAKADKQKAFNDVSYYRNQAEGRVKAAKTLFKDYKKKDEALSAIEKAYADASARGNAFVETVQLNLTATTLSETTLEPYVAEIKKAIEKLDATIDAETKKKQDVGDIKRSVGITKGITGDVVEGAVVGLAKAGVVIWQAAQTAKKEEIENIKTELEKRRWKDWGQIKLDE